MPIKSNRVKILIDEESGSFVLFFRGNNSTTEGPKVPVGDANHSAKYSYQHRVLTVRTWDEVQAAVELARRGMLESEAEARDRMKAGKLPKVTQETVEEYLARGGTIKKIRAVGSPPPEADDDEAWDSLLDELASSSTEGLRAVG